jgi:hypothetical protein
MNWYEEWMEECRQWMYAHRDEIERIQEQSRQQIMRRRAGPPMFVTPKMGKLLVETGIYEMLYGYDEDGNDLLA